MASEGDRLVFRRERERRRRLGPMLLLVGVLALLMVGRALWPTAPPEGLLVEVVGEVPRPGWYRLSEPTVAAALQAAGSERQGSEQELHEGDRVVVGVEGLRVQPAGNPLLVALPVDVNLADEAALTAVPGIGAELAQSIIADRERRGPFYALGDLRRVKGVGEGTVASLRPMITVGEIGPRPPPSVLNLNTATASELERLPGIGPVTASRIVVDREERGPFRSIDDLERVKGIGPKTVAKISDRIRVGEPGDDHKLSAESPGRIDTAEEAR